MPKARIVAVDREASACDAAQAAGADESIKVDLTHYSGQADSNAPSAASPLSSRFFDIVNLDLCAGATEESKTLFYVYAKQVARPGVMMVTFSYGRDVVEYFKERGASEYLVSKGIPETVASRIEYLAGGKFPSLRSIILYTGNEMPMCSLLFGLRGAAGRVSRPGISVTKLEAGDFELFVTHPDVTKLYDCPAERVIGLRRKHAAWKAVMSRQVKASA